MNLRQQLLAFLQQNHSPGGGIFLSKQQADRLLGKQRGRRIDSAPDRIPDLPSVPLVSFSSPVPDLPKETQPAPEEILPAPKIPRSSLKERSEIAFAEMERTVHTLFPRFQVIPSPPDDMSAKAMSDPGYLKALAAETVFFIGEERDEEERFLHAISGAISQYFGSTAFFRITGPTRQEHISLFLRHKKASLLLASQVACNHKALLPFVKEIPASRETFIGTSRVIVLQPLTAYFSDPEQKKNLWHMLCNLLTPRSTQE